MSSPASEPLPAIGEGLRRLRLDLGYDGTGFSGWARQPGRRTVEGVVSAALARVTGVDEPALVVAGRTDAGVHARGQVCHVDLPADHAEQAPTLARRLRGVLPADVRLLAAAPAPDGFDARFSATGRRYVYRCSDDPRGVDPLRRHEVLHHRRPLDVDAMHRASAALLGEHDFAAFCRRREGASTVRTLRVLGWRRCADGVIEADVRADAFCHSMVRALVGAMLPVGDGRRPVEWPADVLRSATRHPGVGVVPPHGLVLEGVDYPSDDRLAAQQRITRRFRG